MNAIKAMYQTSSESYHNNTNFAQCLPCSFYSFRCQELNDKHTLSCYAM